MTSKQPYQELFDYLHNELNVIALQTQMQEIEALILKNHEQQIKDAYNQGYRDAHEDWHLITGNDVANYSNAKNYYNETFKNDV